jgi:hypothetical protein
MPMLRGTLDPLVLKTLSWSPMHAFEIAAWIEERSGGRVAVDDAALLQALHRLEERRLLDADWGVTENGRRARYYKITPAGRLVSACGNRAAGRSPRRRRDHTWRQTDEAGKAESMTGFTDRAQIRHEPSTERASPRRMMSRGRTHLFLEGVMSARRACLVLCAIVAAASLSGSSVGAQTAVSHPDFTGSWKMDTTKFDKRDAALSGLTLTVSNRGDTLLVVTDVVDTGRPPVQMRAIYVSKQAPGGQPADTLVRASVRGWLGDTLVLRRVEQRPDRTLNIEERWTLDKSGRTLARSQTVVDGIRWSRQTLLFTRQ